MGYRRKRPHAKCEYCDRVLMPTADGRFRPHVRHLKAQITPAHRADAGVLCQGTGRVVRYEVRAFTDRPEARSSLGRA